jgi:hypothetical protein
MGVQGETGVPLVDMDNQMLDVNVPAQMTTGVVPTPLGQRLAVTIRTSSATVTVFLPKDIAENWRDNLSGTIAGMTGLILPPSANGHLGSA